MAKTKTTPRAPAPTQVTRTAKWPNKTKKFLADISAALDIFADEISSVGDCRAMAYETFILSYRTVFTHIWPKIKVADVKIVLQSVKDKELNELCRMSQMMSSDGSKPALIKENHPVPALENILGSMVNRLPDQKLPDKDTCTLISTIFSDLAEAHKHYSNAARGIADIATLIAPGAVNTCFSCSSTTNIAVGSATGSCFTSFYPSTTSKTSNHYGRKIRDGEIL